MSTRKRPLSKAEIQRAFEGAPAEWKRPIVSPNELAAIVGLRVKTIYDWIARGRLDGTFRKRGKHHLIWRDRALEILFNGADWR